jgi:hypothetical protein
MAQRKSGSSKKTAIGKKAATKKIAAKSPSVKRVATKGSPTKKAAPRMAARFANVAAAAAAAPAPALQVFTGTVALQDVPPNARLDGVLMSMDTNSCSTQGVVAAHVAFRGKDGQQASVQGFEWDCGEAVIHITQILR